MQRVTMNSGHKGSGVDKVVADCCRAGIAGNSQLLVGGTADAWDPPVDLWTLSLAKVKACVHQGVLCAGQLQALTVVGCEHGGTPRFPCRRPLEGTFALCFR